MPHCLPSFVPARLLRHHCDGHRQAPAARSEQRLEEPQLVVVGCCTLPLSAEVAPEVLEHNGVAGDRATVEVEAQLQVELRRTQEGGQAVEREEGVRGCAEDDSAAAGPSNEAAVGEPAGVALRPAL